MRVLNILEKHLTVKWFLLVLICYSSIGLAQTCSVPGDCSGCPGGISGTRTPTHDPTLGTAYPTYYLRQNFNIQNRISFLVGEGDCGSACCDDEFSAELTNCPSAATLFVLSKSAGNAITVDGTRYDSPITLYMDVNRNFAGMFNIKTTRIGRSGFLGGGCGQNGQRDENNYSYCILQTPGRPIGIIQEMNNQSSVKANGAGEARIDLKWLNTSGYCSESITKMRATIISSPDGVMDNMVLDWTTFNQGETRVNVKTGLGVTVFKYGIYKFRPEVKDKWGNIYNNFADIVVEVVPSCTFDANSPGNVSVLGAEVINGGAGTLDGGYKLNQGQTYLLDVNKNGLTTDFCYHYTLVADNGIIDDADVLPNDPAVCADVQTDPSQMEVEVVDGFHGTFNVKLNVPLGSYRLYAIRDLDVISKCRAYPPIRLFVGGSNLSATRNCLIVLPRDLTTLFPTVGSSFGINYMLTHFVYTVTSSVGIIVQDGVILQDGAILNINVVNVTPAEELVDNNKNWVKNISYNDIGEIQSETKSFFDNRGRPTQSQVKLFENKVIMAAQLLYDLYGRPAISTLPAPVIGTYERKEPNECGDMVNTGQDMFFQFKSDFITKNGLPYSYANFDNVESTIKRLNPDPIDNQVVGSLGWYYSHNNSKEAELDLIFTGKDKFIEPNVGKSFYPYSRTLYYDDGRTINVQSQTIPGDLFKAGAGHNNELLTKELDIADTPILQHYFSIRNTYVFPGDNMSFNTLFQNVYKNSAKDVEGKTVVNYVTREGVLILAYNTASGDKSYHYYNAVGRLVCSISPNGVNQITVSPTAYTTIDKTTYKYNGKGQLIELNEIDAGITKYMYRKDGRIRFSQNAKQVLVNKFSYTNYDVFGRAFESGEFDPIGTSLLFGTAALVATVEDVSLSGGLVAGVKSEQIIFHYDYPDSDVNAPQGQTYINRGISYTEKPNVSKTWYSYDSRGRVSWTAQKTADLGTKKVTYTYDKSGNVQEVAYNRGESDQFFHVYQYDKDNRLKKVYTSTTVPFYSDGVPVTSMLNLEASYSYYLHGPLKRVELAGGLQGVDYLYTVQGWLKSINSHDKLQDPGKDANDLFGMTLSYFDGDYTVKDPRDGVLNVGINGTTSPDRYNGLIRNVAWFTKKPTADLTSSEPVMYQFGYDNKNQLSTAVWGEIDVLSNYSTPMGNKYKEGDLSYDANGNIKTLSRHNASGVGSQVFTKYNYLGNTNKLTSIDGYNKQYTYDELGQNNSTTNTTDNSTLYYEYNVRGMQTAIYKDQAYTQPLLKSYYDDQGRCHKKVWYNMLTNQISLTTNYSFDATGNVLAIYNQTPQDLTTSVSEYNVYGAARIGQYKKDGNQFIHTYELKDHVGSVRALVWKNSVTNTAEVLSYTDYYPFGLQLRGYEQNYHRYGYQGEYAEYTPGTEQKDANGDIIPGSGLSSFELRNYDPVIGRWTSTDIAGQFYSPYLGMGNNPVSNIDPDGAYSYLGAAWRSVLWGGPMHENLDREKGDQWGVGVSIVYEGEAAFTVDYGSKRYDVNVERANRSGWPLYGPGNPSPGTVDFDPMTQLMVGQLAMGIAGAVTSATLKNAAKTGWKVGQPITNLTAKGNVPAWSTVRQRFWKNEAFLNGSTYSESNLLRMKRGLAPQRLNPNTGLMESMELHHHIVPQRNGGLFDFMKVWPDEHRALDPFRR